MSVCRMDDSPWCSPGTCTDCDAAERALKYEASSAKIGTPIRMRLPCEGCGELHIDEGEFATKPHHTHQCAKCGLTWRPAVENTVGVRFLWEQAK